jgi:hypothetical protein
VRLPVELPFEAPIDARGVHHRGRIYLVADNITSAQDARDVIAHEMIGHFGLTGFFGRDLDAVLGVIHGANPSVQMLASKWRHDNTDLIADWKVKYGMTDAQVQARSIEEALATMAERGDTLKGWRRLAAVLQTLLRNIGAQGWANTLEAKTDAEALLALKKADMFVRRGVVRGNPWADISYAMFSRTYHGALQKSDRDSLPGSAVVNFKAVLDRVLPGLDDGHGYTLVLNVRELFALVPAIEAEAKKQGSDGSDIDGVLHDGHLYFVEDRIRSDAHLETVIFHELTHAGIDAMLADTDIVRKAADLFDAMGGVRGFNDVVDRLGLGANMGPYREAATAKDENGKPIYTPRQRNELLIQELLAFTGENVEPGIRYRALRLLGAIRQMISKLAHRFGKNVFSELGASDVVYLARSARDKGSAEYSDRGGLASLSNMAFEALKELRSELRTSKSSNQEPLSEAALSSVRQVEGWVSGIQGTPEAWK